jgi:hypothetical protein
MAYVINLTDGTTFATIADGTINTSSSMTLVGKNYAGYGEFLDENFIHMLENSSNTTAPPAPLTGQVWWDKGNNLLKVYNGTTWKTISAASAQSSAPTSNVTGDLWYDTTNQQLKVYTGTGFIVVGPAFSSSEGQTGALPESIEDTGGTPHAVTTIFVNNIRVAIVSKDAAFTPVSAYSTAFPRIYPGVTVSKSLSAVHAGNVINNGNLTLGAGGSTDVVVVTASGANITGYVSASGNILGSNVTSSGFVTATGNITGGNIATGGLITATGNITGANLVATNFVGTTVSVTGNVTGGNVRFGSGVVSGTGNITGGNVISGGLVQTAAVTATGNITGGNILTGGGVTATGTVTSTGNVVAGGFFLGDGGLLSNVSAAISVSRIESGTSNVAISGSGGNVTVGVAGTSNVAVISTTGITAAGITVPSISKSGSNAVGNIGSASNYFNQVFATATTALYADVAERFHADEVMEPGTVVELGGEKEITRARAELSDIVFGVISTKPAFTMNGGAGDNDTHPPVAMTGRVPVKVSGTIRKGDRLVSAGDGLARAARPGEATPFNVIGRALESKLSNDIGTVEAIVSIK